MYAPKSGEHILEAARKIIGRDIVEQCQWKVHEAIQADADADADENLVANRDSGLAEGSYKIEALLPNSKYGKLPLCLMIRFYLLLKFFSDPRVISNAGQFLSVDSRPVSCTRGTFKKIVNLYKSYVGSGTLVESSDKPKDPVLCMHISCPRASYDVNVEPAKDDVLFMNVDFVLGMVEKFFKDVYGDVATKPLKSAASVASNTESRGFEVLLARKREPLALTPNQTSSYLDPTSGEGAYVCSRSSVNVPKHTSTTADCNSNPKSGASVPFSGIKAVSSRSNRLPAEIRHVGDLITDVESAKEHSLANGREIRQPHADLDTVDMLSSPVCANRRTDLTCACDGEEALRDPRVSNPWTFAKINTPIRQYDACGGVNNQLLTPGYSTGELDEIIGRQAPVVKKSLKPVRHSLPTPQRSHARQRGFATFRSSSPEPYPFSSNPSGTSTLNPNLSNQFLTEHSSHGFSTLDSWIQRPPDADSALLQSSGIDSMDQSDPEILPQDTPDFVSARTILMGSPGMGFSQVDENLSFGSSSPERLAREEAAIQLNLSGNDIGGDSVGTISRGRLSRSICRARCDRNSDSVAASVSAENQDMECNSQSTILSSTPSVHPDLAKALDYEVRKQAAIKQWKASQSLRLVQNKSSQTLNSSVQSPHQNRYRRALASLRHPGNDNTEADPAPALEDHDPRAYLIRSQEQDKFDEFPNSSRKRRKNSCLPLEKVHEQSTVRDLTYIVDTTGLNLSTSSGNCASSGEIYDKYILSGTIPPGFSTLEISSGTVRIWEEKVRKLLKFSYQSNKNIGELGRIEAKISFWPLIQTHLAIYP